MTSCEAIGNGLQEIPSAYHPYIIVPGLPLAANDADWARRLKIKSEVSPEWAKVGFWAELEPVEFSFEE